uniref:Uncharacterized protein n=1 Tax=Anguilla anguilla TaxID=7936 RepID=A0A0E9UUZ7_ANGAN
MVIYNQARSK